MDVKLRTDTKMLNSKAHVQRWCEEFLMKSVIPIFFAIR
jgi:hypothetical protein